MWLVLCVADNRKQDMLSWLGWAIYQMVGSGTLHRTPFSKLSSRLLIMIGRTLISFLDPYCIDAFELDLVWLISHAN